MEKYNIITIDKATKEETVLHANMSEKEAESFCDAWGWVYDDGKKSYWLGLEKMKAF